MFNGKITRPRPVKYDQDYKIIKSLATSDPIYNLADIGQELIKVFNHYEKINLKKIPENLTNTENQNFDCQNINNNIIYNRNNKTNENQNNDNYNLNFTPKPFNRPDKYILYSSEKQIEVKSQKKEYEFKYADEIFLNLRDNFITIEELENIIIDIDKNAMNDEINKLDEDKARIIVEKKYPNLKEKINWIINHYKERRLTSKKSLLRQKWRKTKKEDKFLKHTFCKIPPKKAYKRNYTDNEYNLKEIEESKILVKNDIMNILDNLLKRENTKKNLFEIENMIFHSQCMEYKNLKISNEYIETFNDIKRRIDIEDEQISHFNLVIDNDMNSQKESKKEEDKVQENDEIGNINILINNNSGIKKELENINNNSIDGEKISTTKNSNPNSLILNNDNHIQNTDNNTTEGNIKKLNFGSEESNIEPEPILHDISLNCLEDEEKDSDDKFRLRIRLNRRNKIVIDRYIQNENDMNPFNDDFNNIVDIYKNYKGIKENYLNAKNFENMFFDFNKYKYGYINNLFNDSCEYINSNCPNSNKEKQFLKKKRELV